MLISVTTAKTRLTHKLLVTIILLIPFMLWTILVVSFIWNSCVTVLLQPSKVNRLATQYFNWELFFLIYFLRTPVGPCEWACGLWINLFGMFVFLISQSCLTRFQWNLCYPLPYAYSTSIAIFRLILLLNITPEHTLHSRVKDSITHNSTVILSSNFLGRLIC